MMKNLSKNFIVSLVMGLAIVLFLVSGVNASQLSLTGNTSSANATSLENVATTGNTANTATTNATTLNTASVNTTSTNVVKVNTVSDGEKDLPQTGESDIYVVTAIGAVAVVIGSIAYIKSRKYDIK